MQYDQFYLFIIQKLNSGLPAHLSYHSTQHTLYVTNKAVHLAKEEGVSGDDLLILKTAALLHDSGFLQNHLEHEAISCEVAKADLPKFGYSSTEIDRVCELISATKIPQSPKNKLSEILCDADLYYLGSSNYPKISELLFEEYKKLGIIKSRFEWLATQAAFLKEHHYFTNTAKLEQQEKKEHQLAEIKSKIKEHVSKKSTHTSQQLLQDLALNALGVIIAAFALKCFLVPNRFFDGGVTGLSLLLHELYHINLSVILVLLNLPFIILSFFTVNKQFSFRILSSVIFLSLVLLAIPEIALTTDKLLISVFGGIFLGMGIGLVMRTGAALDGIEVLALYTLKRTSFTITEIILFINIMIFSIAAFKFGIETGLYSVLTYFAATRTIDYVVEGIQAYTGVTIISGKSDEIKYELVNHLGRGITVYKGERGFLPGHFEISTEVDIIFTVITRLEMRRIKNLVYRVDPKAFVFASTIKEAGGGILKRRHAH
ncbi:MAG TPA: YitT family protein [Ferruginibacter sp.]|nr:YitT family protein [Niastella sp.]HRB31297.1 YitT family protein [Ferruginibacter sp.]